MSTYNRKIKSVKYIEKIDAPVINKIENVNNKPSKHLNQHKILNPDHVADHVADHVVDHISSYYPNNYIFNDNINASKHKKKNFKNRCSVCKCCCHPCPYPPDPSKFYNSLPTPLINVQLEAMFTDYTDINYYPWTGSSYYKYGKIIFDVVIGGINLDIRLYDSTHSAVLAELANINQSGIKELEFIFPLTPSRISIQIRKYATVGLNPQIFGINLLLA